ncbi:class I SAM-dependent methyltransferase [Spirochaeta isovalerica]|uniref:SAM-dependent methyltransferase n=1 Tax=Spirochaeta isovalerica TaxID=150 RepID=A0A841REA0_9SPIO|nr:class I SAM-dependent methyltransferase [Spirochaeta isovalerica]MBB6481169.1 SAM-dependent methyltransferase [Spirochaeta isovalerica]
MSESVIPELYKRYFIDKQDERRTLFKKLADKYKPGKGIYPGSFTHITPSFYIPDMTYVDSDKRIARFFRDPHVLAFLEQNKNYQGAVKFHGIQADFSHPLNVPDKSFDIMFSFYAGLISQDCKRYLKDGGILVCNNSHGDASIAYVDTDYKLEAVVNRRGDDFTISQMSLDQFFQKRDGTSIDREKVKQKLIGENFTKKAYAYIFRYRNPWT